MILPCCDIKANINYLRSRDVCKLSVCTMLYHMKLGEYSAEDSLLCDVATLIT